MSQLHFYINGQPFFINDPDPRTLLVDFLRSPEVGLTGTKKSCGQGGCGACTVMLSYYKEETKKVYFESINSCLRPICSIDGMEITTTEGIGSVNTQLNPAQYQVAKDNGSQCGFCTPGWVMNMHAHLVSKGKEGFTKKEIEDLFDGNICRCTGYRPILYAFKHFATDWDPVKDNKGVVQCIVDPAEKPVVQAIPPDFPDELKDAPRPVSFQKNGYQWMRVLSLDDLRNVLKQGIGPDELKLVVGNTSYGIYNPYPLDRADYYNPHYFVDVAQLRELHYLNTKKSLSFGAATTYTELLNELTRLQKKFKKGKKQTVDSIQYMAHRTAGKIVRNTASIGGNTMIAIHHIEKGSPFPSDMFTAMAGLDAQVKVYSTKWKEVKTMDLLQFANKYADQKALNQHSVLLGYEIPYLSDNAYARTYKVAQRTENAHSIVNACIVFDMGKGNCIDSVRIVLGGITPIAMQARKTERVLKGKSLNGKTLQKALHTLRREIEEWNEKFKERLAGVPNEGFSDEYRIHLAESYLYQHFIYTMQFVNPQAVSQAIASGSKRSIRPVTTGKQNYEKYPSEYPVNEPLVKLEAFLQASGEAVYNQDRELLRSGLIGAWVNSTKALAKISYQIPDDHNLTSKAASVDELCRYLKYQYPGFYDYVTYRDIPNQEAVFQGSAKDDPIMVKDEVTSYGQSIGIILADTEELAEEIAYYVAHACIKYKTKEPLISLTEALKKGQVFKDCPNGSSFPTHIWKITRKGTNLKWTNKPSGIAPKESVVTKNGEVDGVDCLIIEGTQEIGGQIHFYMGCQTAIAIPQEHDNLLIYSDTQSPDSVQSAVMETLNLKANEVDVRVKRVAGGYGGKTTRSPFVAAPVAVAAWKHRRPVKVMMRRENDTAMVGHRHPTITKYQIAIGTGKDKPENEGKIMGLKIDWWFNGGNTYDCSFTVMDCMQLRSSSGYYIPNYQSSGDVAQTNISSNTAFRAFGMLQGILGLEDGIEAAAWQMGIRPEEIRGRNLYKQGQTTPYGQLLDSLYIDKVWEYTKKQAEFDKRLTAVKEFNKKTRWKKRGISMIPILYGSGYNAVFLEQGGALVEIYDQDGTIIVRQGGVDMGQGLNTKVTQIVAEALNVPLAYVKIGETDNQVVPNPISTGASTGSAYNGAAAQEACEILRERLEAFCYDLLKTNGSKWCEDNGVNFWDYKDGWRTKYGHSTMWANIVNKAYSSRINLSQQVRFRQAGGAGIDTGLSFHDKSCPETVNYFVGFTYSAACSEVEVDILTGVTTVLRSDIIYDVGKSLNPAIDIGQIEGAFVQGVGYVLTEALVYQEEGEDKGRLNTLNTWRYKPPAHTTIPIEMNVDLFPRSAANVEPDPNLLFGAKEVGEPPLVLGATIYFAVKHAVLDARSDKGNTDWFRMDAPLTPQQVREHALVDAKDMIF